MYKMQQTCRSDGEITATFCDDSAGGGFSVNPKQFFVSSKEKRSRRFLTKLFFLLLELGGLEGLLLAETVRC